MREVSVVNSAYPRHLFGSGYTAAKPSHTDSYLWPPVLNLLASLPPRSRILDNGCGNGFFTQRLSEMDLEVCGVDLEESGIFHARNLCPDARFEVASVYDDLLALFQEPFDVVVSLEVIEHLYDPRAFVARIHECLRPGGLLVISTPYHGYLKNVALALSGKLDAHFTTLWDGGHIKFWSRKTLTALLEEKDFRVDRSVGAGRLPYLWKSMILAATRR